jgi:branched-chain amino acid transport system ATP-binding protein
VEDIHLHYGGIEALNGISFSVESGSILSIIGANGAGKSSLLKVISNTCQPNSGEVYFKGQCITEWPAHKIVKFGISRVAEERHLFFSLTVLDNLKLGAYIYRGNRQIVEKQLTLIFTLFPKLYKRQTQVVGTLSGGEQQMLAIGRALMAQPELLLLDEPSMGLSPLIIGEIYRVIHGLHLNGTTILLVEQNARAALAVSNYGLVMEMGHIVFSGKGYELLENPRVREAYLGK